MKARLCLVASAVVLAAPAFAQEPLATTDEQMQQQTPPAATEPAPAPAATEPAPPPSPPAGQAEAPADQMQQSDAPATVVITDLTAAEDGGKLVQPWGVPVDSIEQMDVYDANGKKIGEVDAVLQDKDGEIKGVAVGYGGFLGFGEKGAILTLDQVQLKDGTLVTDINEEQLAQQPEWGKK